MLALELTANRIGEAATDVALAIVMRNVSAAAIEIFPDVAQIAPASGWHSPMWHVELSAAPLRELRHWYGPPGMPPSNQVFQDRRQVLAPGAEHRVGLAACYLPHYALMRDAIDPERMDGITDDELAAPAVLAMMPLDFVRKQNALRPGRVAFIADRGPLTIRVRYTQEPWFAFTTKSKLDATSNEVVLR